MKINSALIALLSLIFFIVSNSQPLFACDTDIKKSDGFKELAEKLKCLNAKIELVYKKTPDFDRQKIVIFEPSKPIDVKADDCLKTSTLPNQFRLVLRDNMKFCQDDGWMWGRGVIYNSDSYKLKYTDQRDSFYCRTDDDGCTFIDIPSGKKFTLFLDVETIKGKKYFIGNFKLKEA